MTGRRKGIRLGEPIKGKEEERKAVLAVLKEAGTKVSKQKSRRNKTR